MACQVTLLYRYFQGFSQHFFMFKEGTGPKSSHIEVINVMLMSDSIFGFMTCASALCFKYLDVCTLVNPLQFTHPSTPTLSVLGLCCCFFAVFIVPLRYSTFIYSRLGEARHDTDKVSSPGSAVLFIFFSHRMKRNPRLLRQWLVEGGIGRG